MINKFAATFGSVLADEVHEIIDQVRNAAEAKTLVSFYFSKIENLHLKSSLIFKLILCDEIKKKDET